MKKANKAIALALAAIVAITPVSYTYAADYKGEHGEDGDLTENQEEDGHSTFAVLKAKSSPQNLSFEVPLYVTMAAIDGRTSVSMPKNYSIENTSAKYADESDTSSTGYNISVVGITFTKLEGATYATVETPGTEFYQMIFSIGGVVMPAISNALGEVSLEADMKASNSVFYTDDKFVAIPATGNTEMNIPLEATLSALPNFSDTSTAVAQFKVCYTIGALDSSGDVLGSVYTGDSKVEAGLE